MIHLGKARQSRVLFIHIHAHTCSFCILMDGHERSSDKNIHTRSRKVPISMSYLPGNWQSEVTQQVCVNSMAIQTTLCHLGPHQGNLGYISVYTGSGLLDVLVYGKNFMDDLSQGRGDMCVCLVLVTHTQHTQYTTHTQSGLDIFSGEIHSHLTLSLSPQWDVDRSTFLGPVFSSVKNIL